LDMDRRAHELFRLILTDPEGAQETARETFGLTAEEFQLARHALLQAGLLLPSAKPPGYAAVSPEAAVARLLALEEAEELRRISAVRELRSTMSVLTENLLSLQAGAADGSRIRLVEGIGGVVAALGGAAVRVQKEVLSMHPGAPPPPPALALGMERNRAILARGVTMRCIHLNAMAQIPHGKAHLQALAAAGAKVRLAAVLPFRLTLFDGVLAYMAADTGAREIGALEIRGRDVCSLLRQTFEYCWVHGTTPPGAPGTAPVIDVSERETAMLRMLAAGNDDDMIAHALGVSTRTLRRMMTGTMEKIGAETRFQAGARAAALGLLSSAYDY
jgi:DNA-binding CsgD family transcriptional regulator